MKRHLLRTIPLGILLSFATASFVFAQDEGPTLNEIAYAIDNIFLLLAAVLVLFMQAGFAMLEAGLSSAKTQPTFYSKTCWIYARVFCSTILLATA